MEISDFLIRVVFIGLPGIIANQIYQKLKCKSTQKDWEDLVGIVIFALTSYALYGIVVEILRAFGLVLLPPPLRALFEIKVPISWVEIASASVLGVVLAFLGAFVYNKRWWNRLGQALGVTKKFGDGDVWSYFLNLPASAEWVFVRDYKLDLAYFGWIKAYSESERERELIIMDVQVFCNATSERLYEMESIYLARKNEELSIEIPKLNQNGAENG